MKNFDFSQAGFTTSVFNVSQLGFSRSPEIVFSGKSNSGKSSLINKLCGQKHLARISASPGKTASINYYQCGRVYLVDLPGYGFARVPARVKASWSRLVEGYFSQAKQIALIIQLIDIRHNVSEDDCRMLQFMQSRNLPFTVCLTKADKLKKTEFEVQIALLRKEIIECLGPTENDPIVLSVSSENGQGILELKKIITAHI